MEIKSRITGGSLCYKNNGLDVLLFHQVSSHSSHLVLLYPPFNYCVIYHWVRSVHRRGSEREMFQHRPLLFESYQPALQM